MLLRLVLLCAVAMFCGCASLREDIPSAEERCTYAAHATSVPTNIPMKGTTTIRREGVLLTVSAQLCTLGKESEITSHSWMFPDTDRSHERVIVIWINEVLLAVSSNGMLQFIVAREMARYEEGRMCSMSGIPEYLPCEHQLDRFATRIVGMEAALQSLETMHVTLTLSGSRTFVLMHMGRRIQMLREYKEQLAQPKDSNQDNDLAQPDPQEDTG